MGHDGRGNHLYSRFYAGLNMLLAPVGAPMYEREPYQSEYID